MSKITIFQKLSGSDNVALLHTLEEKWIVKLPVLLSYQFVVEGACGRCRAWRCAGERIASLKRPLKFLHSLLLLTSVNVSRDPGPRPWCIQGLVCACVHEFVHSVPLATLLSVSVRLLRELNVPQKGFGRLSFLGPNEQALSRLHPPKPRHQGQQAILFITVLSKSKHAPGGNGAETKRRHHFLPGTVANGIIPACLSCPGTSPPLLALNCSSRLGPCFRFHSFASVSVFLQSPFSLLPLFMIHS